MLEQTEDKCINLTDFQVFLFWPVPIIMPLTRSGTKFPAGHHPTEAANKTKLI